jgi:hypothetical protein
MRRRKVPVTVIRMRGVLGLSELHVEWADGTRNSWLWCDAPEHLKALAVEVTV